MQSYFSIKESMKKHVCLHVVLLQRLPAGAAKANLVDKVQKPWPPHDTVPRCSLNSLLLSSKTQSYQHGNHLVAYISKYHGITISGKLVWLRENRIYNDHALKVTSSSV